MLITSCTIELKDISPKELQELSNFINNLNSVKTNDNCLGTDKHLLRLKEFRNNLTQNQQEAFDYFMKNPGEVYSDDIRNVVAILKPHGALPGTFKAIKRWQGLAEDCPFYKLRWDSSRKCGVYRGLTPEEISYLSKK